MIEFDRLMAKFCDAGARALRHYAKISGENPCSAPECVMPVSIMRELGLDSCVSVTLETSFSLLRKYHHDARGTVSPVVKGGTRRADMALYWGPPDAPKDEHHLFALAEFKRGNLEAAHGNGDRARLCRLLKEIDSCQFGIVCGWVETRYAAYQKQCAERAGDRWYQSAVPTAGDCVFCARVFSVTADAGLDTAA